MSSLVQELAAKACLDSLAEACLGVGGQSMLVGVQALFRSWLPGPVWELVAEVCSRAGCRARFVSMAKGCSGADG